MEESIWMYFGIIMAVIALAMIVNIFITYNDENNEVKTHEGIIQLGRQADIVCKAPRGTKLSTAVTLLAGSEVYTFDDRLCATYKGSTKCVPSDCNLGQSTLLNLTNITLFETHEYQCSILNNGTLQITCEG